MPDTPNHVIADPDFPVIYIAADTALYKFYPDSGEVFLWKTLDPGQFGYMLGLGGPAVSVAIELLRPTWGATGGGVWHYTRTLGWVMKNTGLPADKFWYRVVANPRNADEWIVAGGSDATCAVDSAGLMADSTPAFWRTTDAGLTWASISITASGALGNTPWIEFSSTTPGAWIIMGNADYMVRGVGNASTFNAALGGGLDAASFAVADGQDDDLLMGRGGGISYYDSGNTAHVRAAVGPATYHNQMERFLTDRSMVTIDQGLFGVNRGEVWWIADYRTGNNTLVTTVIDAAWVTSTLDGTVYVGGFNTAFGLNQVREIRNISTSADEADVGPVVNDAGVGRIGFVRSDRQTRTAVAATIIRASTTSDLVVLAGGVWSRLAGPQSDGSTIADAVEVIVRG